MQVTKPSYMKFWGWVVLVGEKMHFFREKKNAERFYKKVKE